MSQMNAAPHSGQMRIPGESTEVSLDGSDAGGEKGEEVELIGTLRLEW